MREAADRLDANGEAERAALLRSASPHWLRHSRATHLLDEGVDRRVVKAIMRHANDQTLDQYVHADDSSKQEAAAVALPDIVPTVAPEAIDEAA